MKNKFLSIDFIGLLLKAGFIFLKKVFTCISRIIHDNESYLLKDYVSIIWNIINFKIHFKKIVISKEVFCDGEPGLQKYY